MFEYEYKFLFQKAQFYTVLSFLESHYKKPETKLQLNYYYDTRQLAFYKKSITLRVRQTEHELLLQTKKHLPSQAGAEFLKKWKEGAAAIQTSIEYEKRIKKLPRCLLLKGKTLLDLKGCMTTLRQSFFIEEGCRVDLDTNYYLGICDYEMELEFDQQSSCATAAADTVISRLTSCAGELKQSPNNKSNRFFTVMKGM